MAQEDQSIQGASGSTTADVQVIAKTDRWLVLFKPPGWLTIPGRAPGVPVLSEWAQAHHAPVWTVHRLDRETSGVILFARTADAHREANGWFEKHEIRKAYDCLVEGELIAPMTRVKSPVAGLASITQIESRECFGGTASWVRAQPLTGRRHQIRVHLSAQGHPIFGDPKYRGKSELALKGGVTLAFGRVALHAARLELPTREVFEAPWPVDFSGWVLQLREASK
jgi:23S rRNA-/tRNA-specific pseudouridylate synthase